MKTLLSFFRGLRAKLTLTYTLVTVLALLALEIMGILSVVLITSLFSAPANEYFTDAYSVLNPQARGYLQPGQEDLAGLQGWLDELHESGFASLPPQGFLDSPAAKIIQSDPIYVLSPKGTVLAQSPRSAVNLIGQPYPQPDFYRGELYTLRPDGNYHVAIPVTRERESEEQVGTIVMTLKSPPPLLIVYWPVLLIVVLVTGLILLAGVTPFGALFGFVMSRRLTRRLARLTAAADAWSEGNFDLLPEDRSGDEISTLARRMRHMAERIQTLLQTRKELAMMEERNRLARELHDTVKQQIFATLLQVRAGRNLLGEDPAAAEGHLNEAETLLKTSQNELGRMITELRPAALDGQGLPTALQEFLATWYQHSRIPAEFRVQNERVLPLEVEQSLYRVAQEALSNVARHSRASAVTVQLEYEPAQVSLIITDNGVGFSRDAAQHHGFGLYSMRDRMAALGGKLEVESSSEHGTTLRASAPLLPMLAKEM